MILAGGSGTRFWPLSTPSIPKQVLPLLPTGSTAAAAAARLHGLVPPERVLLVTGPHLAAGLQEALGLPPENVLVEQAPKSTAPALAWATFEARRRDPEAVVLSLHADWYVPDAAAFRHAAAEALALAESAAVLVTVGVTPTRPETGYGYLVPGEEIPGGRRVSQFKEKPTHETALALLARGALWNSGLFAWRADTLLAEIRARTPEIAVGLPALEAGRAGHFFDAVSEVSIDVGVLERSPAVTMVQGNFAWDDVGTWEALRRVRSPDARGNVHVGPVTAVETDRTIAWSDRHPIVLAWVEDLVVVAANGRILVLNRHRAGDMKTLLDRLPPSLREVP
ncbi:MAG: mannose-1-phosphate guanylyltransferase [Gemmatimonadales bacterium]